MRGFVPQLIPRDIDPRVWNILDAMQRWAQDESRAVASVVEKGNNPGVVIEPDNPGLKNYFYLPGRSDNQIGYGGDGSAGWLKLRSTRHSTKGLIYFGSQDASVYDDVNDELGIGTTSPSARLHVIGPDQIDPETSYRPDAFSQTGSGWGGYTNDGGSGPFGTDLHTYVNETPADDSDFVMNYNASTPSIQFDFSASDPGVDTGHVVRFRAWTDNGLGPSLTYSFDQDAVVIKSGNVTLTTTPGDLHEITLSEAQAQNIDNYANLNIKLSAADGTNTTRVSWIEFAVPSAVGASTNTILGILQGGADQTEDALQVWNSSDTVLGGLDANGYQFLTDGTNRLTIRGAASITAHTLIWPGAQGAASSFLKNDGSGNLSWDTTPGAHALLSATHTDTDASTPPARGSLVIGNASNLWDEIVLGGSGTFLRSDGTDPAWTALTAAMLPAHTHADGTEGGVLALYAALADDETVTGEYTFRKTLNIGDASSAGLLELSFYESASTIHMTFGENFTDLGDSPLGHATHTPGARFYVYKDSTPPYIYDNAYGQGTTSAWVMIGDQSIPYIFWTNRGTAAGGNKRVEWDGDGNQTGYGRLDLEKGTSPGAGTPGIRMEESGAGSNYMAWVPAASIASNFTMTWPGANAAGALINDGAGALSFGNPTPAAHNLLSLQHGDTLAASVARGGLIIGNSTPAWSLLAIGGSGTSPVSDGTDITWGNPTPAAHDLLSAQHGDTTAAAVSRGSIMYGVGATAKWTEGTLGTDRQIWISDGTDLVKEDLPRTRNHPELGIPAAVTPYTAVVGAPSAPQYGASPRGVRSPQFSGTADTRFALQLSVPDDWVDGTDWVFTFWIWTGFTGLGSFTSVWLLDWLGFDNSQTWRVNHAVYSEQLSKNVTINVDSPTTEDIQNTAYSYPIEMFTLDGSKIDRDGWVRINCGRDATNVSDDFTSTMYIVAWKLEYTSSA